MNEWRSKYTPTCTIFSLNLKNFLARGFPPFLGLRHQSSHASLPQFGFRPQILDLVFILDLVLWGNHISGEGVNLMHFLVCFGCFSGVGIWNSGANPQKIAGINTDWTPVTKILDPPLHENWVAGLVHEWNFRSFPEIPGAWSTHIVKEIRHLNNTYWHGTIL